MQTKTKEEKQELLQLYRQSGMSVRAFAEEFELNLGTFRNWLYKKPAKNIPADDGCSLVEVEALKVKQCMDSQNVRIRKNETEIFIPVSIGLPVIEKIHIKRKHRIFIRIFTFFRSLLPKTQKFSLYI